MEKEPKNPGSPEAEGDAPAPSGAAPACAGASEGTGLLREVKQEVKAQVFHNTGYLRLDWFTLFWLFVAGCVIGLAVETVFHAIVYGGLESRAGLVWGPFSPIYGVGAVVLTLFLNRFYHSHNLVIFLVAMVVGSVLEYVTSWGMEFFWGAVAWNYSGTFGSINGRTNFAFGMMWGLLGLVWVRVALPAVKQAFSHVNAHKRSRARRDGAHDGLPGRRHRGDGARPRPRGAARPGRPRHHLGAALPRRALPRQLPASQDAEHERVRERIGKTGGRFSCPPVR